MKRIKVGILSFALLLTGVQNSQADLKFSDCLLDASTRQMVSLGKPLPLERLGNKSKIKIGVLPFYFKDQSVKTLTEVEKSDYLEASSIIRQLSNQKIEIEVTFLPSFGLELTTSDFGEIVSNQHYGYQSKDLGRSTWGFVKQTINSASSILNFSNLDSLILEGGFAGRTSFGGEAMQFFRGSKGNVYESASDEFYSSIPIRDGYIDNAILFDSHKGAYVVAHELLHNFGLTDLYGTRSGPGDFSIMAGGSNKLLNYEKAVLGWFPNEYFKCFEYKNVVDESKVENRLVINNIRQDSILLLKKSNQESYIIEIVNSGKKQQLLLYLLEQEKRPPVSLSFSSDLSYPGVFDLANPKVIGSIYKTSDFDLLISNVEDNNVELVIVPKNLVITEVALNLHKQSEINRDNAIIKFAAEELKAKQELEIKLATENAEAKKKAKQETEVKLPKLKTIICTKGKIEKKITSSKPLCPSGYQKKLKSK